MSCGVARGYEDRLFETRPAVHLLLDPHLLVVVALGERLAVVVELAHVELGAAALLRAEVLGGALGRHRHLVALRHVGQHLEVAAALGARVRPLGVEHLDLPRPDHGALDREQPVEVGRADRRHRRLPQLAALRQVARPRVHEVRRLDHVEHRLAHVVDALLRLDDRLVEEAALGLGGGGGGAVVGAGRLARPALAAARRLRVVAVERAGERPELAEVEVAADELLRVVQQQRAERQVEVEQLDDAELDRVLARADLRAVLEDGLDVRAVLRLEEVGEAGLEVALGELLEDLVLVAPRAAELAAHVRCCGCAVDGGGGRQR